MAKFDTLTVHAGYTPDATGAVMPAIYATSTYAQPAPGEHAGYEYSRSANPTRTALESAIAELEGGSRGYAFASGLAACSTVLELLDQGSHLVAVDDCTAVPTACWKKYATAPPVYASPMFLRRTSPHWSRR